MFVMKFVYKFYDMEDVEELYHMTRRAGINLSMKPLEVVKNETVLPNPLAITDYLDLLTPKRHWQNLPSKEVGREESI